MKLNTLALTSLSMVLLTGCGSGSTDTTRALNMHKELVVVDESASDFTAKLVSIGSIYLESQLPPLTVGSTALQASDVNLNGINGYISYSAYDASGTVKVGAVEQVQPYVCDNLATLRVDYCLRPLGTIEFPTSDIFASWSDGTNLYATGSTSVEDQPTPARLYKIPLNASTKAPTTVSSTVVLPSYAGTGVMTKGTKLYATYGTSADPTKKGGLRIMNTSDLSTVIDQPLYDARAIASYPNDANKVWVARGKESAMSLAGLVEYNANGTGVATSTYTYAGNTIAESKSSVLVGNELLLSSAGDAGFKVICKATGAVLHTQAAVTVTGIPAARTVTNSVTAAPGYIFAANGEAGLYVYQFRKTTIFGACNGVSVTLLGRLSLDSDGSDATYTNAELSANSVSYFTTVNVLNIITAKLIVVASGNKGISLINISGINISLTDVDDF